MNNSFCPHCRSGHDPVLRDSTWSCGTRFNDAQWRTKECYKRNLELANKRNKRLEEIGDEMRAWCNDKKSCEQWDKIKQDKYE